MRSNRMRKFKPSPSMAVAITALVVASTGTGLAASGVLIKRSSQIGKGVIKGRNIAPDTIAAGNLLPKVRGLLGTAGSGLSSTPPATPSDTSGLPKATEVFRPSGPTDQAAGASTKVLTLKALTPGTYMLIGKAELSSTTKPGQGLLLGEAKSGGGQCTLDAQGDADVGAAPIQTPFSNTPATLTMFLTRTIGSPTDITITCTSTNVGWSAATSSITAIQLASSTKAQVTG
jgi:hypothetical protein